MQSGEFPLPVSETPGGFLAVPYTTAAAGGSLSWMGFGAFVLSARISKAQAASVDRASGSFEQTLCRL